MSVPPEPPDEERQRPPSWLGAPGRWLRKRREQHKLADLAARVAANTAARVLASALVAGGTVAGLASIPDTLDGPDARPVAAGLPVSAEAVEALASDAEELRAALAALTRDLEAVTGLEVPEVEPLVRDLLAIRSRLDGLGGRVADAEQAIEDAATVLPPPDLEPLRAAVDAVVADVVAARDAADAAALLAGQAADLAAGHGDQLAEAARDLAAVADEVHLLAADLDAAVADVTALADRVAALEAELAALTVDVDDLAGAVADLEHGQASTSSRSADNAERIAEAVALLPVTAVANGSARFVPASSSTTVDLGEQSATRELLVVIAWGSNAEGCTAEVSINGNTVGGPYASADGVAVDMVTASGANGAASTEATLTLTPDPESVCSARATFTFLPR